jgi:hypothetical protein
VGTYPCSNCGSTADTATGCPRCGRTIQEEITELDKLIFSMQQRNRQIVDTRSALMARLQGAITIRQLLVRSLARERGVAPKTALRATAAVTGPTLAGRPKPPPLPTEPPAPPRRYRLLRLTGRRAAGARAAATAAGAPAAAGAPEPAAEPAATAAGGPAVAGAATTHAATPGATTRTGGTRTTPHPPTGARPGGPRSGPAGAPPRRPAPDPEQRSPRTAPFFPRRPRGHPLEGSPSEMQNVPLALGGLLLFVAAVVLAAYLDVLGPQLRALVLSTLTLLGLLLPVPIARRGLAATADTAAAVGLAMLLVDGWTLWDAGVVAGLGTRPFAALVCLVTAVVAAAYRPVVTLRAPKFVAVAALQPVLPLLAWQALPGAYGRATIFAAVAFTDLLIVLWLRAAEDPTPFLPALAWGLYTAALLLAAALSLWALSGAQTARAAVSAAAAVLVTAAVGLAGGLSTRRWPLPDIAAGGLVLAFVAAVGRLGSVLLPGRGLMFLAAAVAVAAVAVRGLMPVTRGGPRLAGALAAALVAAAVLVRGLRAIAGPIQAVAPAWGADLTRYHRTVAAAAGTSAWQLLVAALLLTLAVVTMLPRGERGDAGVLGGALTALLAPAALVAPWSVGLALLCFAVAGIAMATLMSPTRRGVWLRAGAGLVVGAYAAMLSAAAPAATALVLGMVTLIALGVVAAPRSVPLGPHAGLVGDLAQASAAFALPGAATAAGVVLLDHPSTGVGVLALAFLTVAGTLSYAAVSQVARRAPAPLLVLGTTLGTVAVSGAALAAPGRAPADVGVGLALLAGAVALCAAPVMETRRYLRLSMDGYDLATAVVTGAVIAALARTAALLVPGLGLVTTALLVLFVAVGVRSMPPRWQRGPQVGGGTVGAALAAVAAGAALAGTAGVLLAVQPVWHTTLAAFAGTASTYAWYGAQVPFALVLLAAAGAVGLPRPYSAVMPPLCLTLAAMSAPAALGLSFEAPVAIGGLAATAFGVAAAISRDAVSGQARLAAGGLLMFYTIAGSLVRPDLTAITLFSTAAINVGVAVLAARTARLRGTRAGAHLVRIGGAATAAGLCSFTAAAGVTAAALDHPPGVVFPAALAAAALGLAAAALLGRFVPAYLPWVTAGVATGATAVAVTARLAGLPIEVFAATAVLLAVVAELIRAAYPVPEDEVVARPARRFGFGTWMPARATHSHAFGIGTAAGPATAIAGIWVLPAVIAALLGPYYLLAQTWQGAPASARAGLGPLGDWVGGGGEVLAALILTLAATLGAIGLPESGPRDTVTNRVVAVVVPGAAATTLIAPASLGLTWSAGPVAALAVAVACGLSLALTRPVTAEAPGLRVARRIVLGICVAAGGAGLAGSLATRDMTLVALAVGTIAGLVAAGAGVSSRARTAGWVVATLAGHLLALVASLVAGLSAAWAAFAVLAVSAALLTLSVLLPRLRAGQLAETMTVEAGAYAGSVLGLLLAASSPPHLSGYLAAWGAVLSIAAGREGRPKLYRRVLVWLAIFSELSAWWLLMTLHHVKIIEAYTLAFALATLIVGYVNARRHPDLSSWTVYGVALVAAFLPSLALVLSGDETPLRRILLLLAAPATVALGVLRRRQAPIVVGSVVTVVTALHELANLAGTALWALLGVVGLALVLLGANSERRRTELARLRGVLGRLS